LKEIQEGKPIIHDLKWRTIDDGNKRMHLFKELSEIPVKLCSGGILFKTLKDIGIVHFVNKKLSNRMNPEYFDRLLND
jgi:hypothetical protein